jgi:hypothetical protein
VDGKQFATLMEMLVPMKVEDLQFKIVAGTAKHIRPGDKPVWQMAVDMAPNKPVPIAHFRDALRGVGVKDGSIYNAVHRAVEERGLRRTTIKGVAHYTKEKIK